MIKEARRLAATYHKDQKYGKYPYLVHLEEVCDVLDRFDYSIKWHEGLYCAALLHDIIEDTSLTIEEAVKLGFEPQIMDIVYCVTDEPGENRKERKLKTYPKIAANYYAVIIKLADRIANVEAGGKIDMYKKEYSEFKKHLDLSTHYEDYKVQNMWNHLDRLLL